MCTAGQRVSLTITGPGPSFSLFSFFFLFFFSIFSLSSTRHSLTARQNGPSIEGPEGPPPTAMGGQQVAVTCGQDGVYFNRDEAMSK